MTSDAPTNGRKAMAEALEKLSDTGAFSEIEDPVAWPREVRADRPLWGSNAEQVSEILDPNKPQPDVKPIGYE